MRNKKIKNEFDKKINLLAQYDLFKAKHKKLPVSDEKYQDLKDEILILKSRYPSIKKLADNLDGMNVTIPVDIHDGAEPVIGMTDITFSVVRPFIFQGLRGDFFDNMTPAEGDKIDPTRPTVIKYDLVFRGVEPGSILEELLDEYCYDDEGEDETCGEIVYPVTVEAPNGDQFTADSEEEVYTFMEEWYSNNCNTAECDDEFEVVYPITMEFEDEQGEIIVMTIQSETMLDQITEQYCGD